MSEQINPTPDGIPIGEAKKPKFTIHQLPWPALDAGFTNLTEPAGDLPHDVQGWGVVFGALLAHEGITEWNVAARTDPSWSQYYMFDTRESLREHHRPFYDWCVANDALLRRLRPPNHSHDFPWALLWTIRAVERGKTAELQPEHTYAFALALATLPEHLNISPGVAGSVDVDAHIAPGGAATILVGNLGDQVMAHRWIGKGQQNIRAMARAYGYPLTIKDKDGSIEMTCVADQEGVIKVFKPARPGQKHGFAFLSRKSGKDVWVREDQLADMITRYGATNIVGKPVHFDIIIEADRSRAVGIVDPGRFEHEKVVAAQQKSVEEVQRAQDTLFLAQHLASIQAELETQFPRTPERAKRDDGIKLYRTNDHTELKSFDPATGPTVTVRQSFHISYGRVLEEVKFERELTGWAYAEFARLMPDQTLYQDCLDREANTVNVSFYVGHKEVVIPYPVTSIGEPYITTKHAQDSPKVHGYAVNQLVTATTPLGEVSVKLTLAEYPKDGFPPVAPYGPHEIDTHLAEIIQLTQSEFHFDERDFGDSRIFLAHWGSQGQSHSGRDPDEGHYSHWTPGTTHAAVWLDMRSHTLAQLTYRGGYGHMKYEELLGSNHAFYIDENAALTRERIVTEIEQYIAGAVRQFPGVADEFTAALKKHVIDCIPTIVTRDDLVLVDFLIPHPGEKPDPRLRAWGIAPFGKDEEAIRQSSLEAQRHRGTTLYSFSSVVLPLAEAERLKLPYQKINRPTNAFWFEATDPGFKFSEQIVKPHSPYEDGSRLELQIRRLEARDSRGNTQYELAYQLEVEKQEIKSWIADDGSAQSEVISTERVKIMEKEVFSSDRLIIRGNPEEYTDGLVVAQFSRHRKGARLVTLFTPRFLEEEKQSITSQIRENLPWRKLARPIELKFGEEERHMIYGMPVDEQGAPCPSVSADHWELYMRDYRWADIYPDAYIMVHYRGPRSKSTGKTFDALVREFQR